MRQRKLADVASSQLEFPLAAGQENRLPPEPRLQTNPRQDMKDLREEEDARLRSYGWVDRNAGVVRIPLDEAMKLTLQRGLPARQTDPLIKGDGKFRRASWDEALDTVASGLQKVKENYGPDAVAFLVSAKCTNEENYLLQKLASAAIGTNNVDHCARL